MSTGDHDDELSSLFGRERRAHPAAPAAKARVWSRLEGSLGVGPRDPNGGGGGAPAPAALAPRPVAPPLSRLFVRLSLAACLAGVTGAVWSQLPDDRAPAAIRTPASAERTPRPLTLAAGTTKAVDATVAPPAVVAAHVESAPVVVVAEPSCAICDEQRVLDAGRRGLRERHHDEALAAIREHERRFPHGQLAEERESLRVHVLVAMGRSDDAEIAKSDFRRAFPASPLRDSVEHAGDAQ